VHVERPERSTNGLQGHYYKNTSPIQWLAAFAPVHWTRTKQVHLKGFYGPVNTLTASGFSSHNVE